MNILLKSCLKHLEALVSFDTSNPPRRIQDSGLINYLLSQSKVNLNIIDLKDGSFNLFMSKGEPKYLFNVHLDTVPSGVGWTQDPFKLEVKNDKAYGLGTCDIKGAAACLLALIEEGIENYSVLFSTDEEAGNSTCIKDFLKSKHNYDGIIVAEPTNNLAVTTHRGIYTGTKEFFGHSGHSSQQRGFKDSAIHKLISWANDALNTAKSYDTISVQNLKGLAFNLGIVQGGIKPNIIADRAEVKFGFRPLPGQDIGELNKVFDLQSNNESKFTPGFTGRALPFDGNSSYSEKLVKSLNLDISDPVDFWTEASLFSEAGYSAIVFGPGDISNAHQPNEFVTLHQLSRALSIYEQIVQ